VLKDWMSNTVTTLAGHHYIIQHLKAMLRYVQLSFKLVHVWTRLTMMARDH
jgi:hypothetical protein